MNLTKGILIEMTFTGANEKFLSVRDRTSNVKFLDKR